MRFSCPPRLAFQLFAGQTIQLFYFCTKNKIVVVVVLIGPFDITTVSQYLWA